MPRYRYTCSECGGEQIKFHLYDEVVELDCSLCDSTGTLRKALSVPCYKFQETSSRDKPVGEITREYIEKNRAILEKEKERIKEETYEPP
tara:strand:+ start:1564 stop:1833 length:270 start_codon:yes stop_codon:yes gene_type:complete